MGMVGKNNNRRGAAGFLKRCSCPSSILILRIPESLLRSQGLLCPKITTTTTTTIQTIYWAFRVTYKIIIAFIHQKFILASTQLFHTNNNLASVAHKTVVVPPKIVVAVAALAANNAVWVR
jgi:hypothetical protein